VPERTFFWSELKSDEFRGLDPEATIAVLPVAATEQHGPHLPVMTDTAIAQGMIALLHERLPGDLNVLVLPIQAIGKSNEHLLSPGTLSLSAETLQRVLVETGEGVYRAGLRKLVLANSHGGNASVLTTVTRELRVRLGMLVVATHWRSFGLPTGMYDAVEGRHGIHAGDIDDAVVPQRPREHEQGEEFYLVRNRDGKGIHPSRSDRQPRLRLDCAGS
jgi:creatinine amidohydrolase